MINYILTCKNIIFILICQYKKFKLMKIVILKKQLIIQIRCITLKRIKTDTFDRSQSWKK